MARNDSNIHKNHRERMRQRIRNYGIESLQDHELLEYMLYAFIPRKDTNPIAHNLIEYAGSLENVFNTPPELLETIPNMTKSAALFLSNMPQIFKRYEASSQSDKMRFISTKISMNYFKKLLATEPTENIYMASLAKDYTVLEVTKMDSGSVSECEMDIKKLTLKMVGTNAKRVIVAHNHPSGSFTPSYQDMKFTKWLVSYFKTFNLELEDHIIVSRYGCYSFRENGLIDNFKKDYDKFYDPLFN